MSATALGQEKGTYRAGAEDKRKRPVLGIVAHRPRHPENDLTSQTTPGYALLNSTTSSGDVSLDSVAKNCTEPP